MFRLSLVGVMGAVLTSMLLISPVRAQDETAQRNWKVDAVGKFSFTQAAYSNWREAGVNKLAFSGGLNAQAQRHTSLWKQIHEIDLAYGLIRQDTLALRKAEDNIDINSKLQYRGEGFFGDFNPTLAAQLHTQFAPGYDYDDVPTALQRRVADMLSTPVKVSDFLSPAILKQSIGLTYDSDSWFSQRFGMALKQTLVLIDRFRPLRYGEDSEQLDQPVRLEAGLESHTKVDREIVENVQLISALGLFYAYNQSEGAPDAVWENTLSLGVNDWLSVNLEGTMRYDKNVDDRPQLKERLSIGVSYALI